MVLLKAGVNVAIGVTDESTARNTRFDIAWVSLRGPWHYRFRRLTSLRRRSSRTVP